MSALRIRKLHHRYGLSEVLTDINLDLEAGETLALVGPSGCGKSTLLHIVAGLLVPSEGQVQSAFRQPASVFQEARLLPWQRALDNIALGLKARHLPRPERRQQAAALGLRMGLSPEDLKKYPHELSGGMQSRVALARALVTQPDLLLLDEPFSALDIGLKAELYALLAEQTQEANTAVLIITHDLMEAVRLADRIVMMVPEPGRILRAYPITAPRHARSDAWIYQTTAVLMRQEEVRTGFGLNASMLASASADALQPDSAGDPA